LHSGEKLRLTDLEQEFGVHERTILRDLSRLSFLPIERENGYYFLKQIGNQSITGTKLTQALNRMGIDSLFPSRKTMLQAFQSKEPSILFRYIPVEDAAPFNDSLLLIADAIHHQNTLTFSVQNRDYQHFEPYQLLNERGYWFLNGAMRKRSYSLRVANIEKLLRNKETYTRRIDISESLNLERLHWLSEGIVELIAQVDSSRVPIDSIEESLDVTVLKEISYGSTLISIQTSDIHALMPTLKSWIPNIDIISPQWVKNALLRDVEAYLSTCS
jgi:predicted DNA-binding transcriptional regulator YafY